MCHGRLWVPDSDGISGAIVGAGPVAVWVAAHVTYAHTHKSLATSLGAV